MCVSVVRLALQVMTLACGDLVVPLVASLG